MANPLTDITKKKFVVKVDVAAASEQMARITKALREQADLDKLTRKDFRPKGER